MYVCTLYICMYICTCFQNTWGHLKCMYLIKRIAYLYISAARKKEIALIKLNMRALKKYRVKINNFWTRKQRLCDVETHTDSTSLACTHILIYVHIYMKAYGWICEYVWKCSCRHDCEVLMLSTVCTSICIFAVYFNIRLW